MTTNPGIQDRFEIQAYPTLKLITGGKMYTYDGPRTLPDLLEFVLGGYTTASTSMESVPPDGSAWKKWIQTRTVPWKKYPMIRETFHDFEHILDYRKNAAVILFFSGSFFGFVLGYAYLYFTSHSSTKSKKD